MKKEPGFIYRFFLLFGDALAIIFSFTFAYYFRTHIDPRPYFFESEPMDFVLTNLILLPVWLIILLALGLYKRSVLARPVVMVVRLLIASILGVMTIITYDFFVNNTTIASGSLFPVRGIAVLTAVFCFLSRYAAASRKEMENFSTSQIYFIAVRATRVMGETPFKSTSSIAWPTSKYSTLKG